MDQLKCKVMISFLDDFNGPDLFALFNLNPERIVFIYQDSAYLKNKFYDVRKYIIECSKIVKVEGKIINDINYNNLCGYIGQFPIESTIVSMAGGDRLFALLGLKICMEQGYRAIYPDMDQEQIVDICSPSVSVMDLRYKPVKINDFIGSSGGDIIAETTSFFGSDTAKALLEVIVQNYSLWLNLKNCMRKQENLVRVKLPKGCNKSDYKCFLDKALELNIIHNVIDTNSKIIDIEFKDLRYRYFLLSGSWLEALVYNTIKELQAVDDVKAGIKFLWDRDDPCIENEVDVLAASNGELIYISCKDSEKYETPSLNEIDVYSGKIGGEESKMVLVATNPPLKKSIGKRSEAMGIEIIVFDGNVADLKKKLQFIIKN